MKPPLRLPDIAEDYERCGQSKDRATDRGHSSETARSPQERLAGWVRSLYWRFPAAVPSDVLVSIAWERNVRRTFWIVGIIAGAVLTYTTRYFINGDAINYIEMGEALRQGNWQGFVNLTASPGYAALLGLGQILLDTNRFDEIPLLKLVNLACMIAAMGACDYFLAALKRHYSRSRTGATAPLPWPLIMALVYAMFLFSVLNWVRPRLMAPEMPVFACVLMVMALVLEARHDPDRYKTHILLGFWAGLTYLFKTFFFPFSVFFLMTTAFAVGSARKAVPRVMLSAVIMLLACSPWLTALSGEVGRFSYGETASLNYGIYVKASGKSIHQPLILAQAPEALLYRDSPFPNCTRPATFDPGYWKLGIQPVFDAASHIRLFAHHILEILLDQWAISLVVLLWLAWNIRIGALPVRPILPLPAHLCLVLPALAAIGLYSVLHVEMRYLAPFMLLIVVAVAIWPRYPASNRSTVLKAIAGAAILIAVILVSTLTTVVDQSLRGLISTANKSSYQSAFFEMLSIGTYLKERGIGSGSEVALVGHPPSYWARNAGIRIVAEIPKKEDLLSAPPQARAVCVQSMRSAGVNAILAKGGDFANLSEEGWALVPGTKDFYVLAMTPRRIELHAP
jgi:hypothetical protein